MPKPARIDDETWFHIRAKQRSRLAAQAGTHSRDSVNRQRQEEIREAIRRYREENSIQPVVPAVHLEPEKQSDADVTALKKQRPEKRQANPLGMAIFADMTLRSILVADDDYERARWTPKDRAGEFKHVRLNVNGFTSWIVIDLDRPDHIDAWKEFGIAPNYIVTNPTNGHAHLLFRLASPVFGNAPEVWRPGHPANLLKEVRKRMTSALHGDGEYCNIWCKNPAWSGWHLEVVSTESYRLGDLLRRFPKAKALPHADLQDEAEGRRTALFHSLRKYCYRQVYRFWPGNETGWHSFVLEQTKGLARRIDQWIPETRDNRHGKNRSSKWGLSCTRSTARSVSDWVWKRGGHFSKARPSVMNLPLGMELPDKQKAAQKRTSSMRKTNTEIAIRSAAYVLMDSQKAITVRSLAEQAGLDPRTVSRHLKKNGLTMDEYRRGFCPEVLEVQKGEDKRGIPDMDSQCPHVIAPEPVTARPTPDMSLFDLADSMYQPQPVTKVTEPVSQLGRLPEAIRLKIRKRIQAGKETGNRIDPEPPCTKLIREDLAIPDRMWSP